MFKDGSISNLYGDVFLVTHAPLFSKERWKSIYRLNTNYYKDAFLQFNRDAPDYNDDVDIGTVWLDFSISPIWQNVEMTDCDSLKRAIVRGNVKSLERLLNSGLMLSERHGFSMCLTDAVKGTLFFLISEAKHSYVGLEKIKVLLDAGVNVNIKDMNGYSALQWSIFFQHDDLIELLITRGANVNDKFKGDIPPLVFSAKHGLKNAVRMLIKYGAKVNMTDHSGKSALMYAAEKGDRETTEFLIDNGADINAKTKNGITVLSLASKKSSDAVMSLLIAKGAKK